MESTFCLNCGIEASPKGIADSDEPLLRFCLMVLKNLDLSANARSERMAPAQIVWSSNIWTMPEMRRDSVQGCQFSMSSMRTLSSAMLLTAMCSTARILRTMASAVRVSEAAAKEMPSLSLTISVEVVSFIASASRELHLCAPRGRREYFFLVADLQKALNLTRVRSVDN